MNIKNESSTNTHADQNMKVDYQLLIDLFELLLEWDMKDVQEKEEQKRKEVS